MNENNFISTPLPMPPNPMKELLQELRQMHRQHMEAQMLLIGRLDRMIELQEKATAAGLLDHPGKTS